MSPSENVEKCRADARALACERTRAWQRAHPVEVRNYHLKRNYGVTLEDVSRLLESQGNKCPVCLKSLTLETGRVDHCHATGKVRGILCMNCNTGLGHLKDSPVALSRAIEYLKEKD